jgi:hypothetical protein
MAVTVSTRHLLYVAVCAAIAVAPAVAAVADVHAPAPRILAGCNDIVDTTDSFSMDCVPTVIPDTSDQLTEAEVAEPGWNGVPGGSSGGGDRR